MRKTLFIAILGALYCTQLIAAKPSIEELKWPSGESLLRFFENNGVPLSVYYNLQSEDKELASEIITGTNFQVLRDQSGDLLQALIPVSDELQIHIAKKDDDGFEMDFIPISYTTEERVLAVDLDSSPYQDIINASGNLHLAKAFLNAFKGSVNYRSLKKDDKIVVIYTQRRRDGRVFGTPEIKAAMISTRGKPVYTYGFEDRFYDHNGKELENFLLTRPVNGRISSRFNPKRFHPILKRYRAHLGVDYAAPKGTPVYSAGDGVITFVGVKGGYGKTVIVSHSNGYSTLYAHLNGYSKKAKKGAKVAKGSHIAYVGNTGMSTGPHLHFGLYRDNRAINPESVIKIAKSALAGESKKRFLSLVNELNAQISVATSQNNAPAEQPSEPAMDLQI